MRQLRVGLLEGQPCRLQPSAENDAGVAEHPGEADRRLVAFLIGLLDKLNRDAPAQAPAVGVVRMRPNRAPTAHVASACPPEGAGRQRRVRRTAWAVGLVKDEFPGIAVGDILKFEASETEITVRTARHGEVARWSPLTSLQVMRFGTDRGAGS